MRNLSVIVLNYNQAEILKKCIQSIYQNTPGLDLEIILVDNASTDNSIEMTETEFPEVIVVQSKEMIGFSAGNNLGIKIAQGRNICLLNNDAFVKERCLNILSAFLDTHPEAGIVGPALLNSDDTRQRQGALMGNQFWKSTKAHPVQMVIGACLMFKREVLDKIGLMDEQLFFYNDDLDYCLSSQKVGLLTYFVPEAHCVHLGGHSSKRTFNRKLFVTGFKGGLYFTKKHYGWAALQLYRGFLILAFFITLPFILFPKKSYLEKLRAYGEIFNLAWFWR